MSDVLSSNVINVIVGEVPGPPGVYPPWIEFSIMILVCYTIGIIGA